MNNQKCSSDKNPIVKAETNKETEQNAGHYAFVVNSL
uniref:Uncharacterized protein n=1 Tax=Anguilla anguilla TaxID=7936 RepID=A0A0E9VMN6_ANGAN